MHLQRKSVPIPRRPGWQAGPMSGDDPLAYAVERIGDRWTILIVDALLARPLRFGELETSVEGIAPTVLTKRVRQLERDGIVVGTPYSERPLRLAYSLTGRGRALADAISLLRDWGASHTGDEHALTHAVCGGPLTTRLWCASCELPVGDDAADENVSL